MARFANDPFPGTDYSKYLEWEKVSLPNGETYYVVPSHPGYVFDPVASNATGRKVFRANPKGDIEQQRQQEELQRKQIEQQQYASSPLGQAVPLALGIGGMYAANQLVSPRPTALSLTNQGVLMSDGTLKATAPLANAAASGATAASAPVAGSAPAAAAGAEAVPGSFSLSGIGSAGNYLLPAAGALGAYDVISNDVSPLRGAAEGAASGAAIGSGFGGVGAIPGAIIGGALGLGKSLFFQHESTRDLAKKHTGELQKTAPEDSSWQNYVSSMRDQYNAAPPDPSKPFHGGQYGSWQEYQQAGLDPADLTGVYGNLKTFGPDWAKKSFEEQKNITKALIDAGLYQSDRGEVVITDPEKARQIAAQLAAPPAPTSAILASAAARGTPTSRGARG